MKTITSITINFANNEAGGWEQMMIAVEDWETTDLTASEIVVPGWGLTVSGVTFEETSKKGIFACTGHCASVEKPQLMMAGAISEHEKKSLLTRRGSMSFGKAIQVTA